MKDRKLVDVSPESATSKQRRRRTRRWRMSGVSSRSMSKES